MKFVRFSKVESAVAFALMLSACGEMRTAQKPEPAPPPKVEKETVTFKSNAPQLSYFHTEPAQERKALATTVSGRLAWNDDVTARVFSPVSGRVVEIAAKPGQHVAAGDILAKIKSTEFGQAQADARKALADLKVAERTLSRTRELFDHGAAAQKEFEQAEADHTRAVSERDRTQATLALYGVDANSERGIDGLFTLRSPVEGVVVEKSINPGQEVRSDQVADKPLFIVSDPSLLWLFLDVSELDAASLKPGQEVTIHARAYPDRTFRGKLEIVGEGLDPLTRTIKARCLVDNSEKLLRAELYVTSEINGAASGVDVATKAVFSKDNSHYVFVQKAPGQFERREVRLGLESNGRSVVVDGVSAGESVVTDGCLLLQSALEGENT